MKKTLIALVAMAGISMGAEGLVTDASELTWTALTLTTPANNQLTSGNSAIDWSEETGNLTESWALSFTLDPSRAANAYLFGTVKGSSGADGYTLSTTSAGAIALNQNKSNNVLTVGSYTADDSAVAITLQFVKYVDEAGADLSGEFTLTVGDASATYVVENFDNTVFNKGVNNNVWTNGGAEKLYDISLATAGCVTIASSPVVPEPATATLSLLALCGLAARRRRK
ncbi:MAG: PEP-CTERM sorting domain-containing protein [Akkermansia sp.]|nr:PEP-CTERM sorting domain-containing protein [Akkermansia sp.]